MNEKQILKRLEKLENAVFRDNKIESSDGNVVPKEILVDYSVNIRAYARRVLSKLSGPKKFTLLLAYLAKGEVEKDVSIGIIKTNWNKIKAKNMLGKYNAFYSVEAKGQGWVNSIKYGQYHLLKDWKNAA